MSVSSYMGRFQIHSVELRDRCPALIPAQGSIPSKLTSPAITGDFTPTLVRAVLSPACAGDWL